MVIKVISNIMHEHIFNGVYVCKGSLIILLPFAQLGNYNSWYFFAAIHNINMS